MGELIQDRGNEGGCTQPTSNALKTNSLGIRGASQYSKGVLSLQAQPMWGTQIERKFCL